MSLQQQLSTAFSTTLEKLYGAQACELLQIQKTRPEFEGHITLVVFPLLKLSRKKPEETAEEIAKALQSSYEWIASYNVVKGFLNLSLTPSLWISALQEIGNTSDYGHKKVTEEAPLVMIEYSSPNTNKPLHLGHIRNNLLGYSLSRILDANGLKVVKTNIVNDRGIHICKSMLAWIKWGNQATPESTGKKGDHLVGDFYVEFDKHYKEELKELMGKGMSKEEAENASPLMKEAREMLRKWENGDEEVLSLWRTMNQWVYDGFDETYRRLGVDFDKIYYESETYLRGKEEVLRGLDEGLFVRHEDGSVWADLTQEGLDEKILLRSDGTSVYMTQDIGTAKLRYKDYPIDRMVYVVGNEQEYHFKVLSLLLDRLGFAFGKSLVHFSYGMVELPNGRMKSREGTVVDADDLMDEMIDAAEQIAKEAGRAADFSDEERREVARRVGLGSLKYFILKVDPRKNMTFNPEESIDFNGNTASFIQYTYARIRSLLEKATQSGDTFSDKLTTVTTLSAREIELIQQLFLDKLRTGASLSDHEIELLLQLASDRLRAETTWSPHKIKKILQLVSDKLRNGATPSPDGIKEIVQWTSDKLITKTTLSHRAIQLMQQLVSDKLVTTTTLSAREIELIQQLSDYPSVIEEAGRIYSPALIANYVYDLVKAYNSFYHDCPIMKESDVALRGVRLFLSRTVADTICRAMALLGIEMPEKM